MITAVKAPMFGGKSSLLISIYHSEVAKQKRVGAFKPVLDTRDIGVIRSHEGHEVPAEIVSNFTNGRKCFDYDPVLFDEFQFFDPFIIDLVKALSSEGKWVVCAGLDYWWNLEPVVNFKLLEEKTGVTDIRRLRGTCQFCGEPSIYTDKIHGSDSVVECGGANLYAPVCANCHGKYRDWGYVI